MTKQAVDLPEEEPFTVDARVSMEIAEETKLHVHVVPLDHHDCSY